MAVFGNSEITLSMMQIMQQTRKSFNNYVLQIKPSSTFPLLDDCVLVVRHLDYFLLGYDLFR